MKDKGNQFGWVLAMLFGAMLLMGAATNPFPSQSASILPGPAIGVVTVTQSDSTDNTYVIRGLRCEVAGTVSYVCMDGSTGAETVQAGQVIPAQITRVNDTGTSLADSEMTGYK